MKKDIYKKAITLRTSEDMLDKVKKRAKSELTSVNTVLNKLIENHL